MMDYRESYGEKITGENWLMRNLWKTTNMKYGSKNGLAQYPERLKSSGVKSLVGKALFQQNVRPILEKVKKRHDFKGLHGFRKYFKTHCEQKMKPANVELMLNYDLGVSQSYYKPQEKDILEDYLKAVDLLTVNSDNNTLKKQLQKVEEENKNSEYIIKGKLQEKDEQIKSLTDQFTSMKAMLESLVKGLPHNNDQQQVDALSKTLFSSGVIKTIEN
jgi:predicted RNase H-like nuclease (RuvC/YqgF family)